MKNIINSKVDLNHLLFSIVVYSGLTYIIMHFLAVFLIWGYVGDGVHPKSWDFYISVAQFGLVIVFLYPVILFQAIVNYRKGKYSIVKNLIIVAFVILILSVAIAYNDYY